MLSQIDKKLEPGINELLFEYLGKPNFWVMLQRLDRMAGGLLTLATSKRAGNAMRAMQIARQIHKTYLAIIEGVPEPGEGRLDQFTKKMANAQKWRIYDEPVEGGKSAILDYKVLGTVSDRSLLAVTPITGRTHQIRAQMAYKGHPVVGDKKYGKTEWLTDYSLCLFSHRIQFEHPITKVPIEVTAPAPFDREVWSLFKEIDIVL